MRKLHLFPSLFLVLSIILLGCSEKDKPIEKANKPEEEYLRWIGDIEHDETRDKDNFKVCNGDENIKQYFHGERGAVYPGEKPAVIKKFKDEYRAPVDESQNGLIRIRFIVNCSGDAGRFRTLQSDANLNPWAFEEFIVSQLLNITKDIDNWEVLYTDEGVTDYYYYLIFKITDGQITEILP